MAGEYIEEIVAIIRIAIPVDDGKPISVAVECQSKVGVIVCNRARQFIRMRASVLTATLMIDPVAVQRIVQGIHISP